MTYEITITTELGNDDAKVFRAVLKDKEKHGLVAIQSEKFTDVMDGVKLKIGQREELIPSS